MKTRKIWWSVAAEITTSNPGARWAGGQPGDIHTWSSSSSTACTEPPTILSSWTTATTTGWASRCTTCPCRTSCTLSSSSSSTCSSTSRWSCRSRCTRTCRRGRRASWGGSRAEDTSSSSCNNNNNSNSSCSAPAPARRKSPLPKPRRASGQGIYAICVIYFVPTLVPTFSFSNPQTWLPRG